MKEYIEREAAIEWVKSLIDTMSVCTSIDECLGMKSMKGRALGALHDIPAADVVEVCRCKDCDMWNEEDFSGRKSLGNYRCSCAEWSNLEDGRRVYTGPDEFCSRGERKGGTSDDKR